LNKLNKNNIKKIRDYLFAFDKDAKSAFTLFEREEMRKRLIEIDKDEDFEILDTEIRKAIVSSERDLMRKEFIELDKIDNRSRSIKRFFRYASAAVFIGVIFTSIFIAENNISDQTVSKGLIKNSRPDILKLSLPNIVENKVVVRQVISSKSSSALALLKESLTIEINGISKQIDTLQSIIKNLSIRNEKNKDSSIHQIYKKTDSLLALLNTYAYDFNEKRVVLNLPKTTVLGNVISIDPSSLSKFYISIEGKYYLIEINKNPVHLHPINDRSLLESLHTIEFLNE
jgi:hypothetical protein